MARESHIKVWDPAVRVFHFSLVLGFAAAYLTQERHYDAHLLSGYLVLGLLAFRILWGFVGTYHARFRNFVTGHKRRPRD